MVRARARARVCVCVCVCGSFRSGSPWLVAWLVGVATID